MEEEEEPEREFRACSAQTGTWGTLAVRVCISCPKSVLQESTFFFHPSCTAVAIWPLTTCQFVAPRLWLNILLQNSLEPSPIRGWTAVYGQRRLRLCGRAPANLAVDSGPLPDASGFSNCFSRLPVVSSILLKHTTLSMFTCLLVLFDLDPIVQPHHFTRPNKVIRINRPIKNPWLGEKQNLHICLTLKRWLVS